MLFSKNLFGMFLGFYLFRADDAFYYPFFVNQEGSAKRSHVFTPVHAFFSPYSEFFYQFFVGIGNQRKRKRIFFDEFLMRFGAVYAYSYHFVSGLTQFAVIVAQVTCLSRTARSTGFRIEVEYNLLAFIVAETDFFAFFVYTQQFGCFVSFVHAG